MSSFSTALSGLSASSTALDVTGNNLANLNTEGFKADDVLFSDVMGQTTGGAQIGAGTAAPSTAKEFSQGSIQSTSGAFDAAIQGGGFFVLSDKAGSTFYSRAGSFQVDQNGNLVTATGEHVQGWSAANGVLNATGAVSDISIKALSSQPPVATTNMTVGLNLDAAAAKGAVFSTPEQVVDSLGVTHSLTLTFTKTGPNAWDYEVTIPGQDVTGGKAGTPGSLAKGSLTFDSTGALTAPDAKSPVKVATTGGLASGANDLKIDWSLYNTDGTPLLTQFAQASAASQSTQDGVQAAQVTDLKLANGGILMASYSSGAQVAVAQLALASISNPDTLTAVGNNNYQVGAQTLTPSVGAPQTGTRGQIMGGAIEASNVDLAKEFTNLIVYQRSYQANSKVITTLDQITQVLLQMKP
jgi:flagellar hook protein FlgE